MAGRDVASPTGERRPMRAGQHVAAGGIAATVSSCRPEASSFICRPTCSAMKTTSAQPIGKTISLIAVARICGVAMRNAFARRRPVERQQRDAAAELISPIGGTGEPGSAVTRAFLPRGKPGERPAEDAVFDRRAMTPSVVSDRMHRLLGGAERARP